MSISTIKFLTIFLLISNITKVTSSVVAFDNVLDIFKFYTLQSDAELSDVCRRQSDIYYKTLITSESVEDDWAKEMMDASSKIQAGIFFGNLADLGAFDECLRIHNAKQHIKGKYCLTKLKFPLLNSSSISRVQKLQKLFLDNNEIQERSAVAPQLLWSICVPNGCTAEDVEAHLNSSVKTQLFTVEDDQCQTIESQPKLNSGDWVTIGVLIALACVIFISTSYDILLHYNNKNPIHPLTIAFSWFTGFRKLIKINTNPDLLPCLNGIRVLSMFWIIHGHEILYMSVRPLINGKEAQDWLTHIWSLFTLSSTVSVDTFFFLSGLLLMYGFLKARAKKISFNIPIFYIHRYLRLTPAYAALIILYITIFMKLGSGPLWESSGQQMQNNCKKYWWSSLLYIQNLVNSNRFCAGQSWYLFVDMQLYILSPLILIPIDKWPKITPYFFGILIVIFTIIPTIVAWHYEIPVVLTNTEIPDWNKIYYAQVHTRAGPWIIGLALGYILFQTKNKQIRINKIISTFMWLLTAVVMLYIIFGTYPELRDDFQYSRLFSSIYIGLHRNIWTLGVCWIVFACVHGYGGPVNWFLSLSVFQFFARLTYALYLLSETFQTYDRGILRVPVIFKDYNVLQSFFSTTCFCSLLSIFWVLCFESPFAVIDGVIIKAVSSIFKK